MRVTRKEIARRVEERLECPHQEATRLVEALFGAITASLAAGEPVRLHRFGKLFLRPKRAARKSGRRESAGPAKAITVAFKGFGQLTRRLNTPLEEDLERALSNALFVEKRSEQRQAPSPDATAIVRISGIPVCEFQLSSVSGSGTSFLVPNDARILRNIRVGQEIDIHIRQAHPFSGSALQRCRIVHITEAEAKGWEGLVTLGVKVLGKLPV